MRLRQRRAPAFERRELEELAVQVALSRKQKWRSRPQVAPVARLRRCLCAMDARPLHGQTTEALALRDQSSASGRNEAAIQCARAITLIQPGREEASAVASRLGLLAASEPPASGERVDGDPVILERHESARRQYESPAIDEIKINQHYFSETIAAPHSAGRSAYQRPAAEVETCERGPEVGGGRDRD